MFCNDVRIKDVTIRDAACWVQTYEICLKSYYPGYYNDSVSVSNCRITTSASAVKLGTASHGGFRNIHIDSIRVKDTYRSAVAIEMVDGGFIDGVYVNDVVALNTGNAFFVRLGRRRGSPGSLKNVSIRNMKVQVPFEDADIMYDMKGPRLEFPHNPIPASITGLPGNPLGNGELGANLWVEKNGDLLFYLSRTDVMSEANRLMKMGRIRVSLSPNPFQEDMPFSQQLVLKDGAIYVTAGKNEEKVKFCFYMDPNQETAYLRMNSDIPYKVKVTAESWRKQAHVITQGEAVSAWMNQMPSWVHVEESADVFQSGGKDIVWYHQNRQSVYDFVMKHQQKEAVADNFPDPIRNRVWGVSISADGLKKANDSTFLSTHDIRQCELKLVTHSAQYESVADWKKEISRRTKRTSADKAFLASRKWWSDFWKHSYIYVEIPDEPELAHRLTQSYILQRYMQAGSGRGNFPIKFNGSIFTTDPKYTRASAEYSPDFRMWGNDFWWQNTRLPYYAMLANGDFDQMHALFDFYLDRMSAFKTLASKYYQAKGAFIPETVTIFGTYANGEYGWDRSGLSPNEITCMYIRYIWVQTLELSKLMLDGRTWKIRNYTLFFLLG